MIARFYRIKTCFKEYQSYDPYLYLKLGIEGSGLDDPLSKYLARLTEHSEVITGVTIPEFQNFVGNVRSRDALEAMLGLAEEGLVYGVVAGFGFGLKTQMVLSRKDDIESFMSRDPSFSYPRRMIFVPSKEFCIRVWKFNYDCNDLLYAARDSDVYPSCDPKYL